MFETPIGYFIFNRPRHTRESFAILKRLQPQHLLIVADGPRGGHPLDESRCREVREIVAGVDWPCTVEHNFAEKNLGCKERVVSGLNWIFAKVEQAIILEDDCLPHPDFFDFCATLLERYRNDERVMLITGDNFQNGRQRGNASYYFSKFVQIWGWATWRRAWSQNDQNISFWPEWKQSRQWRKHTPDPLERRNWESLFDRVYRNEIDTWDYPWMASVWYKGGLTATPNINLVTNIGNGPEGTHTIATQDQAGEPFFPLGPLTHPKDIIQDCCADHYEFYNNCVGNERGLLVHFSRIYRHFLFRFNRCIKKNKKTHY